MMKMKKKFFPVFLVLVMLVACLFSLVGCGGSTIVGKYVNPEKSTDIYELKEDNKWSHGELEGDFTFNSESGEIVFKQGDAEVARGTLKDDTLELGSASGTIKFKKQTPGFFQKYGMYLILAVLAAALIVYFFFQNKKGKRRRQEYAEQIEAIAPGNKIKTTGGICGIVAEVCDDGTIVIETGTEQTGKSYVKVDKECIYQTDAKGPMQIAREEAEARRKAEKEAKKTEKEEAPAENPAEAAAEKPAEKPAETPEKPSGEAPEEKQD